MFADLEGRDLVVRYLEHGPIATYDSLSARGAALAPDFGEIEEWAIDWTAAALRAC